jgi:transcriptional regulator with XRE-family HTH domain
MLFAKILGTIRLCSYCLLNHTIFIFLRRISEVRTQTLTYKLGVKIRTLRETAGLTQERLAEAADISVKFTGYIERGQRSPSIKTLEKIAKALKVAPKELFEFPDDEEKACQTLLVELRKCSPDDIRTLTGVVKRLSTSSKASGTFSFIPSEKKEDLMNSIDSLPKLIGARIRQIRLSLGLTQENLAEKADMDFTSIGAAERGVRNLSLKSLARVADALGVPIEELVSLPQNTRRVNLEKEMVMQELQMLAKDMDTEQLKLILEIVKAANDYFKKQSASQS